MINERVYINYYHFTYFLFFFLRFSSYFPFGNFNLNKSMQLPLSSSGPSKHSASDSFVIGKYDPVGVVLCNALFSNLSLGLEQRLGLSGSVEQEQRRQAFPPL